MVCNEKQAKIVTIFVHSHNGGLTMLRLHSNITSTLQDH